MATSYQIAFASLRSMTRRLADELLSRIGGEEEFFCATESQLSALMGCRNKLFSDQYRNEILEKAKREQSFINENSIIPLYYTDGNYPKRLLECDDAPLLLYTIGNCDLNASHIVSIVGTRHATPYGIDFTMKLVENLSKKIDSLIIVSGLAYGIDIAAHRAALHCNVPTVAVLAHGLNTIYPAAHRNSAAEIVRSRGLLISDYMSQDSLHKGNFIARNRIVAGLCDCLVVVESAEKGGALITANIAAGYNRDVMALPGRTSDPYSRGCNRLINRNVAALISDADDLINAMQWTPRADEGCQQPLPLELSADEKAIIDKLTQQGEATINQLSISLSIPMSRLMPLLIDMEFNGLIITFPGGKFRLA